MPLSDHEQRLLEEMEQALSVEDPKFASQMRGTGGLRRVRKRAALGALGFLAGLALIVVGIMSQWWIGIVGFVLMVAAGAYALAPATKVKALGVVDSSGHVRHPAKRSRRGAPPTRSSHGSFMERLEERWDRRRREGY